MSDTNPPRGPESGSERLRETAEEARDAAAEKWDEAKREARDTAEQTAEQARRRAEQEAERGKRMGAGQVHQWASALDRAAEELGPDSMQGQFLRQASDGLEDVARSIEGRSVGDMVDAVAQFGRRNPVAFVGGAMFAGFALSRFATASPPGPAERDYGRGSSQTSPRPSPPRGPTPQAPGPTASAAPGPAPTPGAPSAGGGHAGAGSPAEGGELRLTESMRPDAPRPSSAPGTASAPSGTGRPYPSAGPAPSAGNRDEEDQR